MNGILSPIVVVYGMVIPKVTKGFFRVFAKEKVRGRLRFSKYDIFDSYELIIQRNVSSYIYLKIRASNRWWGLGVSS